MKRKSRESPNRLTLKQCALSRFCRTVSSKLFACFHMLLREFLICSQLVKKQILVCKHEFALKTAKSVHTLSERTCRLLSILGDHTMTETFGETMLIVSGRQGGTFLISVTGWIFSDLTTLLNNRKGRSCLLELDHDSVSECGSLYWNLKLQRFGFCRNILFIVPSQFSIDTERR